ncbi:MAG: hypothetical protein QG653_346 [Patescibacteria group bacterium]|nr:hypothetical protein [Patescibacteria group bacterium]
MKTFIKNTVFVTVIIGTLFSQGVAVFAQWDIYDPITTYPTYDPITTYPTYDPITTYPVYDPITTYPTYDPITTYPTYDPITTYPTYDPVGTYPIYDPITTYPTYDPTTYTYTPPYTYTPSTFDVPTTYGIPTYSTPTYSTPTYSTTGYGTVYGTTGSISTTYIGVNTGTWGTTNWGPGWTNPGTTCPSGTTYVNGQCVISQTNCPTGSTLVNGVCVINNTQCPTGYTLTNGVCINNNTQCPVGTTLVNGVCQINTTSCPTGSTLVNGQCVLNSTICPTGSTLVNGVCVLNNTTCPTGSTLVNGQCVVNTTTCPTGSTLVNGVCQINTTSCPAGTTLVNGQCVGTTTCPPNSTLINGVCQAPISCPAGTTYVNGVCQGTGTTVCPIGTTLVNGVCQINTTTCPPGSILIGGICQISTSNCPIGTVLVSGICRTSTQTCWDGSIIPGNQMCPSQFKTCANGSMIPVNQICYQTCPDGTTIMEGGRCYNAPTYRPVAPVIKFNNVVTSVTTSITNNSARCNGIGLIANGVPSTGWFEYGETSNLGRTTTKTSIGSSATAPFSNLLTNLKPSTNYYCRAVMSNEYGIVKGEIVKFTTKAKAVTYVKPVTTKTTTTKKPVENKVVCVDGTYVTLDSKASSALLNEGQKLIAMQVEKVQGDFAKGNDVIYRLTYKNISDAPLSSVAIKINLPQEAIFVGATQGMFDPTSNTLSVNLPMIAPYSDGAITWTVKVAPNAEIGKSVVTTGYINYMIPGTANSNPVQDEVTAYVVSTVVDGETVSNENEVATKKVIGKSGARFLPQTLIEWLALIAILFIIAILGRSMYASFKQEENK